MSEVTINIRCSNGDKFGVEVSAVGIFYQLADYSLFSDPYGEITLLG